MIKLLKYQKETKKKEISNWRRTTFNAQLLSKFDEANDFCLHVLSLIVGRWSSTIKSLANADEHFPCQGEENPSLSSIANDLKSSLSTFIDANEKFFPFTSVIFRKCRIGIVPRRRMMNMERASVSWEILAKRSDWFVGETPSEKEKILAILSVPRSKEIETETEGEEDVLLDDTSSNNQRSWANVSTATRCGREYCRSKENVVLVFFVFFFKRKKKRRGERLCWEWETRKHDLERARLHKPETAVFLSLSLRHRSANFASLLSTDLEQSLNEPWQTVRCQRSTPSH